MSRFLKLRPISLGLGRAVSKQFVLPAAPRCFNHTKPAASDNFMEGTSASYVEEMYRAWAQDPSSVHLSWRVYFGAMSKGADPATAYSPPPSLVPNTLVGNLPVNSPAVSSEVVDHLKIQLLVRAYQVRGHHIAKLDPLGIMAHSLKTETPKELELSYYNFTEQDLSREFNLGPGILPGFMSKSVSLTLKQIIDHLKKIYCSSVGYEYQHIPDKAQCDWIRQRIEIPTPYEYSSDEKKMILDRLVWSDSFERFIAAKYVSEKRFGLEGCESLIPGMKALIDRAADLGTESFVIGMAHRGRLNVLSNVVRKPNESIFCEFNGLVEPSVEGSGDVKYHLGMNYVRPTPSGKRVHLSLVANPSHLEAVNPVVLGKTRAIQFYSNDLEEKKRSVGVLIHGDAAFAGQGVVYETFGFHELPSYTTGGTIHIVINNQIGFTTDPRFSRSTPYCTDIAKSISAPIFHVNGDDAEAVTFVCQLAADYRQTFKRDVVIDIVCYRKYGHNEVDQPSFTQPRMYKTISKQKSVLEKYIEQLLAEGTFDKEYIRKNKEVVWETLEESYAKSKDYKPTSREWLSSSWDGFKSPSELAVQIATAHPTGAHLDSLRRVGKALSTYPADFKIHSVLKKIIAAKQKSIEEESNIDWATAEALAFGTLLNEGTHVRLSGQDVERGTFSHRHSVLHDQENENIYIPLDNIRPVQGQFTVCNSHLSEFGTLGFELGYSLVNPRSLVMWEAQFGDFANNAQCIIDQFIASGEKKWLQRTGLTLLMPHGYDGQGPEHSSGRIERFLQLIDEHPYKFPNMERQHQDCNMQIVYCTTPANYFHALRRQIHRDFRKPLVCFNSKSLLRHPQVRSDFSEMSEGTHFQRAIPEDSQDLVANDKIRTHIFCSGQVYYTLLKAREQNGIDDVAISRIEQITPFPFDLVKEFSDRYPNAQTVWCQEEPLNMGPWFFVEPRLRTAQAQSTHHAGKPIGFSARPPTSTVATGNKKQHKLEEQEIISQALYGESRKAKDVKNGSPIF
ncbi:2-oxoglutarate dehydrogenase E1 component [Entomophthora muscae]|uniref:2-oxoglutarate dehydrogenase E1 component n=2 Tax=Entomophthora muscae TaxID=34485 RepID=A0ACC2S2G8_9FUNG|nr:2-oxoglutarate dehydrogenase E1 component [Entomophthora muscae]